MRLVGTQASLLNKFKELQIRAEIVRKLCLLYLERQWHILKSSPGVNTIHLNEHCASPYESMKEHIRKTIEKNYPEEVHGMPHGAGIPELAFAVDLQDQLHADSAGGES